jgi:hypothetical protein
MTNLYSINQELLELWRDRDELDEDTFNDTWEALALERAQKINDTISYIKNLKSWSEACKKEAESIKARANSYKNKAENLTRWLSHNLEPREQFMNKRHELKWRQSTETAVTVSVEELPDEFRRISYAPNKTAIKESLQNGGTVPGCSLTKKLNLVIK